MALSSEDKQQIVEIIRAELMNFTKELTAQTSKSEPQGIDIRNLGAGLGQFPRKHPLAADQCCNGCD